MGKYKYRIITALLLAAVLAFSFWWGGDAPSLKGWAPAERENTPIASEAEDIRDVKTPNADLPSGGEDIPDKSKDSIGESSSSGTYAASVQTNDNAGDETSGAGVLPPPSDPEDIPVTDKESTCTLSVRCDTILDNMSRLSKDKLALVPEDGVIFASRIVTFYKGESVFNLLLREMKQNGIHMEFVNTPIYNSAYIEGIGNLYEFDCGELSGWMYRVNGVFPNYGCSQYILQPGDKVEWLYSCNLGEDVGGNNGVRNGMKSNE